MKIVLKAFDKLQSEPMDVPEETGLIFRLALSQSPKAITGFSGEKVGEIEQIDTMAEFERSGKSYAFNDGTFAKIYILRDITKIRR